MQLNQIIMFKYPIYMQILNSCVLLAFYIDNNLFRLIARAYIMYMPHHLAKIPITTKLLAMERHEALEIKKAPYYSHKVLFLR